MARPKRDPSIPGARERIVAAFWALLEEEPYAKMTVREVSERAGVNHNTLYYHFENLDDVAHEALRMEASGEFSRTIIASFWASSGMRIELPAPDEKMVSSFLRVRLILGRGSPQLVDDLRDIVVGMWLEGTGIDADRLPKADWAKIRFVFGGIMAVIRSPEIESLDEYLEILDSGILETEIGLIREIFAG